MGDEIKRMDIRDFREEGYLQEVNRRFFHPMGLALEVRRNKDGTEELSGVWDCRDDPEGIVYGEETMSRRKAVHISRLRAKAFLSRWKALGYIFQPVERES